MNPSHYFNIPMTAEQPAATVPAAARAATDTAGGQPGAPAGTLPAAGGAAGVINSQQGVITFATAPTAIYIVLSVLRACTEDSTSFVYEKSFAVVLSIAVGMLIYWASAPAATSDEGTASSAKPRILGFIFALINSFAIAATVIGVDTTLPKKPGSAPQDSATTEAGSGGKAGTSGDAGTPLNPPTPPAPGQRSPTVPTSPPATPGK